MRAAKTAAPPWPARLPVRQKQRRPRAAAGNPVEARRAPAWRIDHACAFLAGYLCGIAAGRLQAGYGQTLAAGAADAWQNESLRALFLSLYAGACLQLTLALLLGFCALGMAGLLLLFSAKGAMLGLCAAGAYLNGGAKGLAVHWLASFPLDAALLLLLLWFAAQAQPVAGRLYRALAAACPHGQNAGVRRLLLCYALSLLLAAVLCLPSAASARFFTRVLL